MFHLDPVIHKMMSKVISNPYPNERIVIDISTTALFDLTELLDSKRKLDRYAFEVYQRKQRRTLLKRGIAFELAKNLLDANKIDEDLPKIEVNTFSQRFFCTDYSIKQYGLRSEPDNMVNSNKEDLTTTNSTYKTDLFLSDNIEDLMQLKAHGYLTALISRTSTGVSVIFDTSNEYLMQRISQIEHLFH